MHVALFTQLRKPTIFKMALYTIARNYIQYLLPKRQLLPWCYGVEMEIETW